MSGKTIFFFFAFLLFPNILWEWMKLPREEGKSNKLIHLELLPVYKETETQKLIFKVFFKWKLLVDVNLVSFFKSEGL